MSRRSLAVIPLVVSVGGALLGGAITGGPSAASVSGAGVAALSAPDGSLGQWSTLGTGVDRVVWTLALRPDGVVYAGGNFTQAGGISASSVAAWEGASWSSVGDGLTDGGASANRVVSSLKWSGDRLYAAGSFTRSGVGAADDTGLAVWDGTTWSAVGGGVQPRDDTAMILDVLVAGGLVYAAGDFVQAGSAPADDSRIAAWDGSSWDSMAGGFPLVGEYPRVMATLPDGDVVVGGRFSQAGTGPADDTNIARWDGTTWHPLGGGLGTSTDQVYAVAAASDGSVYAGGNFAVAGQPAIAAKGIARWDGTSWSAVGTGVGVNAGAVRSIWIDDAHEVIYAVGNFSSIDGVTVSRTALWDAGLQEWLPMTDGGVSGASNTAEAVVVDGQRVIIAGSFTTAGALTSVGNIAQWTWDAPEGVNVLSGVPGDTVSLSGEGFIGVPSSGGITFGGIPSPGYTRDDTTSFSNVIVPAGVYGTVSIEVDAVGGVAQIGTFTAPPRPIEAAGPPVGVSAAPGDASATVSWSPPVSSGSFPISTYQVLTSPSGRSCVTSTLTCEITGLPNGVEQSVRVRALTGAGWGAWSDAVLVTPVARAIELSGTRDGRRISLAGQTNGFGMGAIVSVWIDAGRGYREMRRTALVSMDGQFEWAKRLKRDVAVRVYVTIGEVRSNRVRLQ